MPKTKVMNDMKVVYIVVVYQDSEGNFTASLKDKTTDVTVHLRPKPGLRSLFFSIGNLFALKGLKL